MQNPFRDDCDKYFDVFVGTRPTRTFKQKTDFGRVALGIFEIAFLTAFAIWCFFTFPLFLEIFK